MTGQHLLALLLLLLLPLILFVLSCKLKLQMKLNINIISQHLKRNGIMIMKRETRQKFGGSTPGGGVLQGTARKGAGVGWEAEQRDERVPK